jgi:hypothetical protein
MNKALMSTTLQDDAVPYFCWDRPWTTRQVREQLRSAGGTERVRLMSWIMREAAFADVWQFLSPEEVWQQFGQLEPWLGRRRRFWRYILTTWHELGKL